MRNEAANPPRPTISFHWREKNVDEYKKILLEKFFQQCQDKFLRLLKQKEASMFFMNSPGQEI